MISANKKPIEIRFSFDRELYFNLVKFEMLRATELFGTLR
jgi:hypothetical protein